MPLYTFQMSAHLAGRSTSVVNAAGSTVASGTLDANARFSVTLPVGDYTASSFYGQSTYTTAGTVDMGDPDRLAALALLPHRFGLLDDMMYPSRLLATGSTLITATKDNVYVKMFQATDDVVITGMSMASGGTTAASGQTVSRFALYHVGDFNPVELAAGRRASFTPIARTDSDTTLFTTLNTLYTRSWSGAGGWPTSVRLRRGEWYAAGWMLLGGVAPSLVSAAAFARPQATALVMPSAGLASGLGTTTELWPYWNGPSFSYDGSPATAWIGLTVDPTSTLAAARTTVLLGDSYLQSYAGWFGWANAQSGSKLVPLNNAGVGGQQVHQMTSRIGTDVSLYAPEVVVLHGGVNDIAGSVDTATMKARYTACLDALRAIPSVTKVVVCTPPPTTSITGGEITVLSEVRAWLLSMNRAGVVVADTGMTMSTGDGITQDAAKTVDGTHPNAAGQQAMANVLDDVLLAL